MEIRGLTVTEFETAVVKANLEYSDNLALHPDAHDTGRNSCRGRIWVEDSKGPGSRTSWSGRHGKIACWHAYRDVLVEIFNINPDATVRTALATYKGREGFESNYPGTAYTNSGSQMSPAYMPELCDC